MPLPHLSDIINRSPVVAMTWDSRPGWPVIYVSDNVNRLLGYHPERFISGDLRYAELLHPEDRAEQYEIMHAHIADGPDEYRQQYRLRHQDGRWVWLEDHTWLVRDDSGRVTAVNGILMDISERKAAERKQQTIMEALEVGIVAADQQTGHLIFTNDFFSQMVGYAKEELVGLTYLDLHPPESAPMIATEFARMVAEKCAVARDIPVRRKDGSLFWADIRSSQVSLDGQDAAVAVFTDVTAQREYRLELERVTHFDGLTGMANRVLLADRLQQAMAQSVRHGTHLAIAYIDIDGFKEINDQYGHDAGDRLLRSIAQRMQRSLRVGDTLARLGGDEFIALMLDLSTADDCMPSLDRLRMAVAQKIPEGDGTAQVSASIGVTFFPQVDAIGADQLLRQADQAMYQAKLAGKNRYHFFDLAQEQAIRHRHRNLGQIHKALQRDEFVLFYQPKVNMRTGMVVGVEALIRWQHPQRGLLAPGAFLPDVEDHPLAVAIGDWVIKTAFAQAASWYRQGWQLPISINVGARQLQQSDFVANLTTLLQTYPTLPAHLLELEVLETSALENIEQVCLIMNQCAGLGIEFALDDFGTGYSSLTYLKQLPAQTLKIDRSFVRDMLEDPEDLAILEGVLGLASAFRRNPVAEGVETIAHGELLLDLGCDIAQGYGIAYPMPADAVPAWIATWKPGPSWLNRPLRQRDDLPLLFAIVEHRAWVAAITAHVLRGAPVPKLNHHSCRFSAWLDGPGRARAREQFPAMYALHREIHQCADSAVKHKVAGKLPEANNALDALEKMKDELVRQLTTLIQP